MRSTCKKLVTDINREKDLEIKLPEYVNLLGEQYNLYATVKMCMNYYTMKEMVQEGENQSAEYVAHFDKITELIKRHILKREAVTFDSIDAIRTIRTSVEKRMKNLTSFTDGYEIYEYILNRAEARVMDSEEEIDIELLSNKLYNYVFMDNDTVLINSKLQLIMSQLPVRMTKMKFFDIVARTLAIYTGSEKTSADEFIDMLRGAVLLERPEGFSEEYPDLYKLYTKLTEIDYKNITKDEFLSLGEELSSAAAFISNEVSVYMLLQEIVNDVYTLLLTVESAYAGNESRIGYQSALEILENCIKEDDMEALPEMLMTKFIDIEGVQETIYENIMLLEAIYEDIATGKSELIESLGIKTDFDNLGIIEKLLSTSLFINIDKDKTSSEELADSNYINSEKEKLITDLTVLFKSLDKVVVRSMMSKLLAAMPIFMNNKQEIKDYFDYVLNNCNDASELTACSKLLNDIMEDED